jgi:hypothetical protein
LAFAQFFGHTVYLPATFVDMASAHDNTGWLEVLTWATEFLNGAGLLLMAAGVVACCVRWRRLAGLVLLAVLQIVLIAKLLPHEFRFLGGLQYGLLAAGAVGLSWMRRDGIPLKWAAAACLVLMGPWLAAELYYARPFAAVALGITPREVFLERHVGLYDDFRALDKILPRDATLYITAARAPAIYAPRPVIFSLADWDRRTPLYWLLPQIFGQTLSPAELNVSGGATCNVEVYRDPDAVIVAYRTPNRKPDRGVVVVRRCVADADADNASRPHP